MDELDDEIERFVKNLQQFDFSQELIEFVLKLQKIINKQCKTMKKLRAKLKVEGRKDKFTQTDREISVVPPSRLTNEHGLETNILETITEAATNAMHNTGFVYEETSGLYYDYNTGYYYNAEYGLYYDGNTGTYMKYDQDKKEYEFHSRIDVDERAVKDVVKVVKMDEKTLRKKEKKLKDTKRVRYEEDDELEEGECSDQGDDETDDEAKMDVNDDDELIKHDESTIPCIRIIVKETDVNELKIGSLYVITLEGGTIGREGDGHTILIKDINISKHHLKFVYDKTKGTYNLIDLGSRNGTRLDGKRMSTSKQESVPYEIKHGSKIELGGTTLLCHVHRSNQTCGHCEPGLLLRDEQLQNKEQDCYDKVKKHKTELKQLRKKFGLCNRNVGVNLATGYVDRAQVRRETVGSTDHNEKTETASVEESIKSTNKGFKMLSKMGWNEGDSLGRSNDCGITEPINQTGNVGTTGLGSSNVTLPSNNESFKKSKNLDNWSKAKERYMKIDCENDESEPD